MKFSQPVPVATIGAAILSGSLALQPGPAAAQAPRTSSPDVAPMTPVPSHGFQPVPIPAAMPGQQIPGQQGFPGQGQSWRPAQAQGAQAQGGMAGQMQRMMPGQGQVRMPGQGQGGMMPAGPPARNAGPPPAPGMQFGPPTPQPQMPGALGPPRMPVPIAQLNQPNPGDQPDRNAAEPSDGAEQSDELVVEPPVVRPQRRRNVYTVPQIQPSAETQAKIDELIDEVVSPEVSLDLLLNQSQLVRTRDPVVRMSVTDPGIVEVEQHGPFEFELIGQREGHTTLTIWFGEEEENLQVLRYLIRVAEVEETFEDRREVEYGDLEVRINELFPNSRIQLIPVLDKLIVRGQARDSEEATQILSVLGQQAVDQTGQLIGPGSVVNLGRAAQLPDSEDLQTENLISLLEVPGEQQIMLKVRVAELTRSAGRSMGMDFEINRGDFSLSSLFAGQGPFRAVLETDDVTLALQALSSNGYSKILAEPNLVTINGRPASFLAGGQFAVPTVVGLGGGQFTQFQSFGTNVFFLPTIIDKDRIRLTVTPTLSSVNSGLTVDGIPGLNTRTVSTTVDLREGQWLAVAGLIEDTQSGGETRVPLLGDLPGIGLLFSNRDVQRAETELLMFVSPELVRPLEAEEVPMILPGMEVTEPNDLDFFVHGRYEGDPECHHRSTVRPVQREQMVAAYHEALAEAKKMQKYQSCQQFYVHGPVGFSR